MNERKRVRGDFSKRKNSKSIEVATERDKRARPSRASATEATAKGTAKSTKKKKKQSLTRPSHPTSPQAKSVEAKVLKSKVVSSHKPTSTLHHVESDRETPTETAVAASKRSHNRLCS